MGIALDIWDELTVEVSSKEEIRVLGEHTQHVPTDGSNLIIAGMRAAFQLAVSLTEQESEQQSDEKVQGISTKTPAADIANCAEEPTQRSQIVHSICAALKDCRAGSPKSRTTADEESFTDVTSATQASAFTCPTLPPFRYTCVKRIPVGQGLGSSSAALVSGLIAGFSMLGITFPVPIQSEILFNIACAMEGHPDNVGPTIYGGAQIGFRGTPFGCPACVRLLEVSVANNVTTNSSSSLPQPDNNRKSRNDGNSYVQEAEADSSQRNVTAASVAHWRSRSIPLAQRFLCVVFLPNFIIETRSARASVPNHFSRSDCIFNASRTALLVHALVTGNLNDLRYATEDRLHQPYRAVSQDPHLYPLIETAMDHGAYGVFLAGAGPAVMALVPTHTIKVSSGQGNGRESSTAHLVGEAMVNAAQSVGVTGSIIITKISEQGAYLFDARETKDDNIG